ncbi:uncharacterized protein LOC130447997 isoform X6 [Diorhabda sublineata]|uniref:uncharacterized protein LOC130447997 isoform X6 n=1 Tax=Diorhabda sublineata TaxID=1163346 RepID=UPI0024E07F2B|nr:uncharacterized protein LOC130447997 isoform X6 [Diorhabda sublineata]
MEQQQFIKEEIYTHDGFAWGMSIKQEMKDEIFTSTFQNLIDESMHPIKQEIDDDLNTNKAMEEYTIKVEKDKSNSHIVNIQNIGNKFKYLKVKYGIRPKSKEKDEKKLLHGKPRMQNIHWRPFIQMKNLMY